MSPQKKPFEKDNDENGGLSWFEQYEARQQAQNGNTTISNDHGDTDGIDTVNNDVNAK